MVIKIIS